MKKNKRDYDEEIKKLEEAYDNDYYDDYDDEDDEYYEEDFDETDEVSDKESQDAPVEAYVEEASGKEYSADDYDSEYDEESSEIEYSDGDFDEEYPEKDQYDEYEEYDEESAEDDEYDGDDEEYPENDEYYEEYPEKDEYDDDYDYNDYYEDDYRNDRNLRNKDSLWGKVLTFIKNTSVVERIAAVFALLLLAGGIATASFYVSAKHGNEQLASFAEVGSQLGGVDVVGKSGLIAIADAEKARAMAAEMVNEGEGEEEDEEEEKIVADDAEGVTIQMTLTSIKSDMKVKFINSETNKLVADLPFEITVVTPDGTTVSYNDHDQDGIIYKKDITAGDYKITPKALPAEYSRYKLDTSTKTLTVKDKVEMKTVDVSNEIKKESQVNVAAEDTAVKNNIESQLTDTVEYVESTKTPVGTDGGEYDYKAIDKSSIVDPTASSSLIWGSYMQYAFAGDASSSGSIAIEKPESEDTSLIDVDGEEEDKKEEDPKEDESSENVTVEDDSSQDDSAELISTDDSSSDSTEDKSDSGSTTEIIPSDNNDDSGKGNSKEEKVPMSVTKITLIEGQSTTISSSKKKLEITLSSSDEDIVSVDGNKITGVKEGSATIIVSAEDYLDAEVQVTVTSAKVTLKDKNGNTVYIKDDDGDYVEATYADYNTAKAFYIREQATSYRYTGWQTIDGKTYYYDKNGDYVTGEQVIQGAKYTFGSDGVLSSSSGMMGIDVSKWNGNIDWNAVKNSGVNFAIIRCGYRGSSQGALIEDPMFRTNIRAATAAGIKVGVYFFTQAVNEVEAVEEASMVVKMISGYNLAFPVYLDVEASNGRGDKISAGQRTANIKAFCGTIQNAGFRAGVYANKTWFTSQINTAQLTGYKIWLAQYSSQVTYTATRYDMWQYTSKGRVSGISGNVDMNICY